MQPTLCSILSNNFGMVRPSKPPFVVLVNYMKPSLQVVASQDSLLPCDSLKEFYIGLCPPSLGLGPTHPGLQTASQSP